MATYYLFETATGYSLFEGKSIEEIGGLLASVQESITSLKRFKKIVKLHAFMPFTLAEQALENMQEISAGRYHKDLKNFLKMNMPSVKKNKYKLAVEDSRLPNALNEIFPDLCCIKNETTNEIFRGIRMHFDEMIEGFDVKNLARGQLGLAHAYSRSKVMTDIKRYDKHIIYAISLIDQLDKDINTFSMRLKEWYSWHFPELYGIVNDNILFAKVVKVIKNKADFDDERMEELVKVIENEEIAKEIFNISKISMGGDLSELDSLQISLFTDKVISLGAYRADLANYLKQRMDEVAPNLSALIGEIVGARLISQAGSLTNLAKYPASTVQILGAEKALFRALKTRGNTPKYGILYHSSFIGRAGMNDKGRISRFLANKCSLASRIDAFFPTPTDAFGIRMNEQVEERLKYFINGERGPSNEDVMHEVLEKLQLEQGKTVKRKRKASSDNDIKTMKKKGLEAADEDSEEDFDGKKIVKKDKKRSKSRDESEESGKLKKKNNIRESSEESGRAKKKSKAREPSEDSGKDKKKDKKKHKVVEDSEESEKPKKAKKDKKKKAKREESSESEKIQKKKKKSKRNKE
ncbi:hypothetical protein SteCoe_35942 [Stentor coeruleus]|uniref:Nucleolar protein 56 n=1 Tax=Stentor coeruleus TaxID=5963 RepID=A0A1R2ARA3_9CILI|nr:hypothetical protein SteCoe_35942 [Stentor coeruleus]